MRGIRLATYASKCIQNELLMYFRQQAQDVRASFRSRTRSRSDGDGNALALQDIDLLRGRAVCTAVEEQDRYHAMHRALAGCSLSPRERESHPPAVRSSALASPLPQHEIAAPLWYLSRSYVSRIEKRALEKLRAALERERWPP